MAGRSDALRAMTFNRHKVVVDITFAAWCEVNIEFVEWLLFEAVDIMFCLGYVRKNVRRYVMSESMSKDMSERMSEDMPERMRKDMSERTSEDCFQSVCEVESNRTHFRR